MLTQQDLQTAKTCAFIEELRLMMMMTVEVGEHLDRWLCQ